jgi:transcriptional regulator with XRE-family HTH domain
MVLERSESMSVSYKIKKLREDLKISQEELAVKSGVSRTIISGLETGAISETSTATLKKLATFFNVKVSDLFF